MHVAALEYDLLSNLNLDMTIEFIHIFIMKLTESHNNYTRN